MCSQHAARGSKISVNHAILNTSQHDNHNQFILNTLFCITIYFGLMNFCIFLKELILPWVLNILKATDLVEPGPCAKDNLAPLNFFKDNALI